MGGANEVGSQRGHSGVTELKRSIHIVEAARKFACFDWETGKRRSK